MDSKLSTLLNSIVPADEVCYGACIYKFDHIAKPLGSLGQLETMLAKVCGASHKRIPDISKKKVLVFCGDNGVLEEGVAQSTAEVTTAIGGSLVRGTTSVSTMAKAAGADVLPIDMGMVDTVEGLRPCKIANGTANMAKGPAMTYEQAEQGILTGIALVKEAVDEGYNLIATGEAGIGNTTSSSAISAVLLGESVELVTGRGSGLSNEGLDNKRNAIKKAIEINKPDPSDPIDVLAKVGGFDIAGMAGAFIGGAIYHVPVIVDGLISSVAALIAARLNPLVKGYILPSHMSAEPAGKLIMNSLELEPIINAGMRLGEGTGAVALMPFLDLGMAVYNNAATFGDINVEDYTKQS